MTAHHRSWWTSSRRRRDDARLDEILRLARLGLYLYPCEAEGKKPDTSLARHGLLNATTDPRVLIEWDAKRPDFNPAVAPWPSNLVIIETDVHANKNTLAAFEELRAGRSLPPTPIDRSPSGGRRLYFRRIGLSVDVEWCGHLRGTEIEVKTRAGVHVPPSRRSAGAYRWLPGREPWTIPFAQLPSWILALATRDAAPLARLRAPASPLPGADVVTRARAYLNAMPPSIEGSCGSPAMFKAAVVVARGFDLGDGDEAFALLAEYNERAQPPWTERELRRKLRDAVNRGHMQPGALLRAERRRAT